MLCPGSLIQSERTTGRIVIEPFDIDCLNPNSYDLHLAPELKTYQNVELVCDGVNPVTQLVIPPSGLRLEPGVIYLGSSMEWTETHPPWVPNIEGKSTLGRLGVSIHATAGFGDVGFRGTWTLEITVEQPIVIKAGIRICQIYYTLLACTPDLYTLTYEGRYQDQRGPTEPRQQK